MHNFAFDKPEIRLHRLPRTMAATAARYTVLFLLAFLGLIGAHGLATAATTTTTALIGTADPFTGNVNLLAKIDACPTNNSPIISGTVQFFEGVTPIGVVTLSSIPPPANANPCGGGLHASQAVGINLLAVSVGTHTYTAIYSGDAIYAPSTAAAFPLTVPPKPSITSTTTALIGTADPFTGNVNLLAKIDACPTNNSPIISGTVQFFEGVTPIGVVTLSSIPPPANANPCGGGLHASQAVGINLLAVSVGTHTYTAIYSGDAIYAPSTAAAFPLTVPPKPSITSTTTALIGTADPFTGNVNLLAKIDACPTNNSPIISGTVQFFEGVTPIGVVTLSSIPPPANANPCGGGLHASQAVGINLLAVSIGTHTYTAIYSGDAIYAPSTAAAFPLTVPPKPSITSTTTALIGTADPFTGNVNLLAKIDACPTNNSPIISGTVQFFEGVTPIGVVTLSSIPPPANANPCGGGLHASQAVGINLLAVSVGTHTYTAIYSGDAIYAPSTAAAFPLTVPPKPSITSTTTALIGTADPFTGNVNLLAKIDACPTNNSPIISGTVHFFEGVTLIGVVTLSSIPPPANANPCGGGLHASQAVGINLLAVSVGTHTYTAIYSGDAIYAPSTASSLAVGVTVLPAVPPGQSFGGPTATLSGNATLRVSGGGALCGFTRAAFLPMEGTYSPPPDSAPPGLTFPHGLIGFVTSGCVPGSTLTFTLTLPVASADVGAYWKYGPTPNNAAPHWYQLPISIQGNVVSFSITDGALGDDDLTVNGTVVDVGGPAITAAPQSIPTVAVWTLRLMAFLLACLAMYAISCSRRA